MLRGRYEHAVDAKGRVAFPARFRETITRRYKDERLVITRHLKDPCLVVYPVREWEKFEERLAKLSQVDPTVTILRRLYVGIAQECGLDKQGRLLVAPDLRRDVALDREAVWSGASHFAELWSKENYDTHVESVRDRLSQGELSGVLEKLAELGI